MAYTVSYENVVFILYTLRLGFANIDQIEQALDICRTTPGLKIGDVLIEMGALDAERRRVVEQEAEEALEESDTMASVVPPASGEGEHTAARQAAQNLADLDDASEQLITEEQDGRYAAVRQHAVGGQARIILTFDEHLRREVALKELVFDTAEPTGGTPTTGQRHSSGLIRFLREARVTGMLEHPNIVPVHELGRREDGTTYYTMRFVRGMTLAHKLRACESLADRLKLLGAFWDVCKAIAFAHSRGVVHRDIKPLNVMVGEFGETVVLDWGVAKVKGLKDIRAKALQKDLQKLRVDSDVTTDGMAIGTPSYMSPEQASGEIDDIDERSDVWGLGALLYEILTGRVPFRGAKVAETIKLVLEAPLKPVQDLCPGVPSDLAAIATKALKKDRGERYESARQLADEIGAYMTGEKVQAYEYTTWELIRRFVVRHKAAVVASGLIVLAVVASLLTARYMRIQELEGKIESLGRQFEKFELRLESIESARQAAFSAFDGDYFREGENKWREAAYQISQLEPAYGDMWAKLRGLLSGHPDSRAGQALKSKLLKRLMKVSGFSGRKDLSDHYRQLLLEEDQDGSFRRWLEEPGKLAVLSHPDGAGLSLHQFSRDESGLLVEKKVRELGTTPLTGVTLPQGSYLIEASLKDRPNVRYPLLVEQGQDRVLSIPLPEKGVIPEGMVFIPPGEFLVGSDDQEEIRQHAGAVPRHQSYTAGFLLSLNEVTFVEYLPFLKDLAGEKRTEYLPGGPYRLQLNGDQSPVLSFRGQSRSWGEKFEFPACPDCRSQDWGHWPVAVGRKAAEAYAKWKTALLQKSGVKLTLRLPSEREWEKAARGADGRKYPCGEKLPGDFAVTRATHGFFQLVHEAGTTPKGASVFGVRDLAGNVEEWVQVGPQQYALKGGSFQKSPMLAMAASRVKEEDVYQTDAAGFRLAASLPGSVLCPLDQEIKGRQTVLIARARACRNEAERVAKHVAYDKSIAFSRQALKLHQAAYGEEHTETATSHNYIGVTYIDKGQWDQALKYLGKALAIRLKVHGPDHLDTAGSYNNIGIVYHGKSDFDRALEYYQKCLDVRLKIYGPEHTRVADSYYNIDIIYWDRFDYDRALEYSRKALNIYIQALGPDHHETGATYNNMGMIYDDMGLYDEALKCHKKALGILLKVLGPNDTFTGDAYAGLGSTYISKGDFKKAREYTEKAMKLYIRYLGAEHFSVVDMYVNLGLIERDAGDPARAMQYFHKALKPQLRDLGPDHPTIAYYYSYIGSAHLLLGEKEKALEFYNKSLSLLEKKYGQAHIDTVAAWLEVAHLLLELGQASQAEAFFQKAWKNGKIVCQKGRARACANAAVARCQLGTCDQEAIALAGQGLARGPNLTDTMEAKAFTLLKTGKVKQARERYCKIRKLGPLSQSAARMRVKKYCPR